MPYQIEFRWFDSRKNETKFTPTAARAYKLVYGLARSDARVKSIRVPAGHEISEDELRLLAEVEDKDPQRPIGVVD